MAPYTCTKAMPILASQNCPTDRNLIVERSKLHSLVYRTSRHQTTLGEGENVKKQKFAQQIKQQIINYTRCNFNFVLTVPVYNYAENWKYVTLPIDNNRRRPVTSRNNMIPDAYFSPDFIRTAYFTFFAAMRAGYVKKSKKTSLRELPGSKCIEHIDGRWRVLDTYLITPFSDYSGGTTYMWYDNYLVWMMQYMGSYQKKAIPCLKAALKTNYDALEFWGGRGPQFFRHKDLTYTNQVTENVFSKHAAGTEFIFDDVGTILGQHRYQSLWMVKLK